MLKLSKLSLLSLLTLFLLVSCGGDDDGPADPGGDTTAPTVVSVRPDQDATGVGPDDEIIVVFDEDMDETSAMGAVSLSPGTVTFSSWTDARTLVVTHSNWAQGVNVSVMLGVAIKDLAGNGLAAPYVWDFWTASTVPSLLRTIPVDGATSVSTGITVGLLFSEAMNLSSLEAATTADAGVLRAPSLEFTMSEGEGDWINMVFASALPLGTPITITISTQAMTASGTNLPAPEQFGFVTTDQVDDTPPNLLSIVPADGSLITPGTSSIVFTFDEAINQDLFVPSMLSGQLNVYLNHYGIEPFWSADGTMLTVPLTTPLPAGLPIVARFDGYFDLAGNQQTTPILYRVDVQGDPDFWPLDVGTKFEYFEEWEDFEPGIGTSSGSGPVYYQIDADGGSNVRWAEYEDDTFTTTNDWEIYRQASNEIQLVGFYSEFDGEIEDVSLSPGVVWARLPFAVESWNGSTTASATEGDVPVAYQVEVFGQEDVPGELTTDSGTEIIWFDCFTSSRAWQIGDGMGGVMSTGVEGIAYAPGIGIVIRVTREEEATGEISDSYEELVGRSFPD